MKNTVSRRDFLKGAAVAALAVSMSGVLTGCNEDEGPKYYEVGLGEFKVKMASAVIKREEIVSTDDVFLHITPEVLITYTGSGFAGASFKSVFSMKIGDSDLTLSNSGTVAGADFPFANSSRTYSPKFSTKERSQYDAYDNGEVIQLYVSLSGQTAVFNIGRDGKVTSVEKQ